MYSSLPRAWKRERPTHTAIAWCIAAARSTGRNFCKTLRKKKNPLEFQGCRALACRADTEQSRTMNAFCLFFKLFLTVGVRGAGSPKSFQNTKRSRHYWTEIIECNRPHHQRAPNIRWLQFSRPNDGKRWGDTKRRSWNDSIVNIITVGGGIRLSIWLYTLYIARRIDGCRSCPAVRPQDSLEEACVQSI